MGTITPPAPSPRQSDPGCLELAGAACTQPLDFSGVVVLLDASLDRLPVAKPHSEPIAMHQGGRDDGLADAGVGAGDEETAVGHGVA
jgi:hypothetical protein